MKNILVIGGGAMGSAFTIPCIDNKNKVTITEPYSKLFIKNLSSKTKNHSSLKIKMPKQLIGNFKHGKDDIESQDDMDMSSGDLNSLDADS